MARTPTQTAGDRGARERVVVSWDEPQSVHVEVLPPPPSVAGVGLRPERLTHLGAAIWYPSNAEWYEHMHRRLRRLAVVALKRHRAGAVLSTLALGWDTALAEAALELDLPLRLRLPFERPQASWSDVQRQRFGRVHAKAAEVRVLHRGRGAGWKRARALAEAAAEADLLLALWDAEDASVRRLLGKAGAAGTEVVNLWASWQRYGGLSRAR
jgi:hypothetical protein